MGNAFRQSRAGGSGGGHAAETCDRPCLERADTRPRSSASMGKPGQQVAGLPHRVLHAYATRTLIESSCLPGAQSGAVDASIMVVLPSNVLVRLAEADRRA